MLKHPRTTALTLAACLSSVEAVCKASLTIDVRAVSTSAGYVISPKMVFFTGAPGDTVTFEVRALIAGSNATDLDEGLLSVSGSFLSTSGGLLGNLLAARDPEFTRTGSSAGLQQDLDGDGDLDVGSNNDASSANFFQARGYWGPSPVPGADLRIATLTWSHTGSGFDTFVNFRPRRSSTAASWFEDASQITSSNFSAGAPVIITLPEPAVASSLLALAALARRRKRV